MRIVNIIHGTFQSRDQTRACHEYNNTCTNKMSSHGVATSGSVKERNISELLYSLCAFYTKNEGNFMYSK